MLKGVLDGIVLAIISQGETYGYEIAKKLYAMGFEDRCPGDCVCIVVAVGKK